MTTISQRVLSNHVGEILRRVEAGETFTVTVGGRPVAELGRCIGAAGSAGLPWHGYGTAQRHEYSMTILLGLPPTSLTRSGARRLDTG